MQDHLQGKMKHVVAGQGGSNGGRIPGTGGEGNGGTGSNASPYSQGGGAAVVPIYNAGAGANIHRNIHHHNAGSCVRSYKGSTAIAAILLAYLLRDM